MFEAVHPAWGQVAVKLVYGYRGAFEPTALRETGIMHSVCRDHPNLVPVLHAVFFSSGYMGVVMPMYTTTLRDVMTPHHGIIPTVEEAEALFARIAMGLRAMHRAGVAHRDIKPENILLRGREVAIADFGLSRQVGKCGGMGWVLVPWMKVRIIG